MIGAAFAGGPPSPPCPGCGGVPTTPKPLFILQPNPLITTPVPNGVEWDGNSLWMTNQDGTRQQVTIPSGTPFNFTNGVNFNGGLTLPSGEIFNNSGSINGGSISGASIADGTN